MLGENLAKLLSARLGDELVVMLQAADGSRSETRRRPPDAMSSAVRRRRRRGRPTAPWPGARPGRGASFPCVTREESAEGAGVAEHMRRDALGGDDRHFVAATSINLDESSLLSDRSAAGARGGA